MVQVMSCYLRLSSHYLEQKLFNDNNNDNDNDNNGDNIVSSL